MEVLRDLIGSCSSRRRARLLVREYVQARLLGSFQRQGAMVPLAFHGGTALRFLFAISRFSEDLDFALENTEQPFELGALMTSVRSELQREGYQVILKLNERRAVHSCFLRLPGLLWKLGLSARQSEVLAVKVEVDTRPPAGAGLGTTVIRRHLALHLHHHDRASLLAGKLHALLTRPYTKGRDVFDLSWYLSDPSWPPPNLTLLTNALRQSGSQDTFLKLDAWRSLVWSHLEKVDWRSVERDVEPFLERGDDLSLVAPGTVRELLLGS